MSKKIIRLDASSLKHSSCILRLKYIVIDGYKGEYQNRMAAYGSAFHIFKEVLIHTEDPYKAIAAAHKFFNEAKILPEKNYQWATIMHLTQTCMAYIEHRKKRDEFQTLVHQGKHLIEKTFSIPLYEDELYVIVLTGTIDDIGIFEAAGYYAIGDEKVTSQDKSKYFHQYKLHPQLITYVWAMKQSGKMYPGTIYEEISKKELGAFINGVFVRAKEEPDKPMVEFIRSEVMFFKDRMLQEYEISLRKLVTKLVDYLKLGDFPREGIMNGSCQSGFRPCEFCAICGAPDKESSEALLEKFYKKQDYDPLKFREIPE